MEDYRFEKLDEGNIKDLFYLFRVVKNYSGSYEKYKIKFDTSYTGVKAIGYFAYDKKNHPVAFYGVTPCFALAAGKRVLIAQAVDAITHAEHRRRGLFEKIVNLSTESCIAAGIHFIYGIPNDTSYRGFLNKFNWSQNGNLIKFQFKTGQLPIGHFCRKYRILNGMHRLYIKLIFGLFPKGTYFENPNNQNENICIERNDKFYCYKDYTKKQLVKLCGISIWMSVDGSLKIGDMERSEDVNMESLIRKLKQLGFVLGVSKIIFQFSPHAYWGEKFERQFRSETALPLIYLNLTKDLDPNKLTLSYGDIDSF